MFHIFRSMQISLNHIHTHPPRFLWMRETRKTTSYTKKEQKTTRMGVYPEWWVKGSSPAVRVPQQGSQRQSQDGPVCSLCSLGAALPEPSYSPGAQLQTHSDTVQHTLNTASRTGQTRALHHAGLRGLMSVLGRSGFSWRCIHRPRLRLGRCPLLAHTQLSGQDTHQQGSGGRGKTDL